MKIIEFGQRWRFTNETYDFIVEITNPVTISGKVVHKIKECHYDLNKVVEYWTINSNHYNYWTYLEGQDKEKRFQHYFDQNNVIAEITKII